MEGTGMKSLASIFAAAMIAGSLAAPAFAQEEMDAQSQKVIGGVIDALIGNRYNVSDREAIRRCAIAAVNRTERQNRGEFRTQPVAYPGYRGHIRVSEITDVERRFQLIRVRGLLDTPRYGWHRGRRGSELSFRCDYTYKGKIAVLKVERNPYWRH
jgi:hypothetical protein